MSQSRWRRSLLAEIGDERDGRQRDVCTVGGLGRVRASGADTTNRWTRARIPRFHTVGRKGATREQRVMMLSPHGTPAQTHCQRAALTAWTPIDDPRPRCTRPPLLPTVSHEFAAFSTAKECLTFVPLTKT